MDLAHSVLREGLLEAYRTRIWPKMLEQWDVVGLEHEYMTLLSPTVTYQIRQDALLRRKSDGTLWYWEDKTTSQQPENFCKGWDKQVQVHSNAYLVEQQIGETISGCFVQGWYKGYSKNQTLYSPLAYAWCRRGQPGASKDQWSFEYRAGWERRPITEVQGGVQAWVKSLPDVIIQQQFPVAGPIPIRRDLAKTYLEQVREREERLAQWSFHNPDWGPQDISRAFPQHFSHCDEYSKYRRPCAFRECCWAPTVGRDPVGSGLFLPRVPHHEAELKWFATQRPSLTPARDA